MRKEFEQDCRNFGHTGFEIGFVPKTAACPVRLVFGADIFADIGQNTVHQVARRHAVGAVDIAPSAVGVIDSEATDYGCVGS